MGTPAALPPNGAEIQWCAPQPNRGIAAASDAAGASNSHCMRHDWQAARPVLYLRDPMVSAIRRPRVPHHLVLPGTIYQPRQVVNMLGVNPQTPIATEAALPFPQTHDLPPLLVCHLNMSTRVDNNYWMLSTFTGVHTQALRRASPLLRGKAFNQSHILPKVNVTGRSYLGTLGVSYCQ